MGDTKMESHALGYSLEWVNCFIGSLAVVVLVILVLEACSVIVWM